MMRRFKKILPILLSASLMLSGMTPVYGAEALPSAAEEAGMAGNVTDDVPASPVWENEETVPADVTAAESDPEAETEPAAVTESETLPES